MKLKVGKKYKTREGCVAEITAFSLRNEIFPFEGTVSCRVLHQQWSEDGRWLINKEHPLDLVSEYAESEQ